VFKIRYVVHFSILFLTYIVVIGRWTVCDIFKTRSAILCSSSLLLLS